MTFAYEHLMKINYYNSLNVINYSWDNKELMLNKSLNISKMVLN